MENKKNRDTFIQMVRALSMICVVMIHTGSCESYLNASFPFSLNVPYYIVVRCIINCCVGVFVFISGHFVPSQVDGAWVKKRLGRILIPYCVWTLFYLGIQMTLDIVNHNQVIITENGIQTGHLMEMLFLGRAAAPFYYCIVMAELIVLTPLLLSVKTKSIKAAILCITPVAYFVGLLLKSKGMSLANMDILATSWISYYYLGIMAQKPKIREYLSRFQLPVLVFVFCAELVSSWILFRLGYPIGYCSSQLKVNCFLYTISVICIIVKYQRKGCNVKTLSLIGDRSFGIFFLHVFVLSVYFKVIELMGINIQWLPVHHILGTAVAVSVSLILSEIIRRVIGVKNARILCGI